MELPAVLSANAAYRSELAADASVDGHFRPSPRTPQPSRRLVVLACMDARLDLFRAMGLSVGDAHILRNAGGRASDALRSLVVSSHLLGTREIGVVHHTDCGLEGVTDAQVAERTGVHDIDFLAFDSVVQSVHDDVALLLAAAVFPDDVLVWGAVYDVDTGELRVVDEARPVDARAALPR